MMTSQTLVDLVTQVAELGNDADDPTMALVEENGREIILWPISGPPLKLTLDEAGDVLTILLHLGEPPADRREAIFEELLRFSYVCQSLPLKPALLGDELLIIGQYLTEHLFVGSLQEALHALRQVAEALEPLFSDEPPESHEAPPPGEDELLAGALVRV